MKEFIRKIPTLAEEKIIEPMITEGKNIRAIMVDDPYVICYSGAKGSGKSISISFAAIKALTIGLPVWLNYPLSFYVQRTNGDIDFLEAQPLDFDKLFQLSEDMQGGFIGIDEYQQWASAYTFQSVQNRQLAQFWAQLRKNSLSFHYGSKKLRWVDRATRDETDLEVVCTDAHITDPGRFKEGEVIYHDILDWSGRFTGTMFVDSHRIIKSRLYAWPILGSFDTNKRFSYEEASKGLVIKRDKRVIDNTQGDYVARQEMIDQQMEEIIASTDKIQASDLWYTLGIDKASKLARYVINKWELKRSSKEGASYYLLPSRV